MVDTTAKTVVPVLRVLIIPTPVDAFQGGKEQTAQLAKTIVLKTSVMEAPAWMDLEATRAIVTLDMMVSCATKKSQDVI